MSLSANPPTVQAPLATADHRPPRRSARWAALLICSVTSLAACGGGGGASEANPTVPTPTTTTVPTVVDAPGPPSSAVPTIGTRRGTLEAVGASVIEPAALRLPSIGVDAVIRPVGVEPDGEMEVPAATDVGWYRFGPTPGTTGSAVLAAHVDYDGRRGAFFELRELAPGDAVEVTMADGSVQQYQVEEVVQIAKGDLSTSGVFDRTGPARLALITCGGAFDAEARSYRDNVVAYAVPLPAAPGP